MNTHSNITPTPKPATIEQLAAIDFTPWDGPVGEFPLSREDWRIRQEVFWMVMNYSHRVMHMTKAEIMADMETWSEDKGTIIMDAFQDISDFIKGTHALFDAAETRILCAGAALEIDEGSHEDA